MTSWNNDRKCYRHASIAWQAVALALLLLPITAPMANAQITLSISILFPTQVDDQPAQDTPAQDTPATAPAPEQPPQPAQEPTAPTSPASAAEPSSSATAASNTNTSAPTVAPTAEVQAQAQADQTSAQSPTTPELAPQAAPQANSDSKPNDAVPPNQEKQLSVEPGATLLPSDRPDWISKELDLKSATHRFVVSSFPTARESDIDSNLDACLEEATSNYVNQLLGDDRAGQLLAAQLNAAFVRTNLLDDKTTYVAELSTTGGAMFQKWVMVEVTKEQQEQIRTWYQERLQRQRIIPLGIGLAGLVAFVGACNLFFRRSASKSQQSPMLKVIGNPTSSACCGKRGGWGYLVAIAIAIGVAAMTLG